VGRPGGAAHGGPGDGGRTIAGFLRPYGLVSFEDTVRKLVLAGYVSEAMLTSVDDTVLLSLNIASRADRERVRAPVIYLCPSLSRARAPRRPRQVQLASWLHNVGFSEYGGGLVSISCTSLAKLARTTDAGLRRAGIATLGERRRLQRHVRDQLQHLRPGSLGGHAPGSGGADGADGSGGAGGAAAAPPPSAAARSVEQALADVATKFDNRDGFHEPWRATHSAVLLEDPIGAGGAAPPSHAPGSLVRLRCADGSELILC